MRRCIEIMRHESPESREQIEHKLKDEGFEKAGHFAAYAVQCDTLRLKPWEAPPCCVWGYDQSGGIELQRLQRSLDVERAATARGTLATGGPQSPGLRQEPSPGSAVGF
jgi:hypothetical protein